MPRSDFPLTTKKAIRKKYNNRCAICLQQVPGKGCHCAHLFDAAERGATHVEVAIDLGVISPGYDRSALENGMLQCPTCHLGYFDPGHIALSLPHQVLRYIVEYLLDTDPANWKPLHEIFSLLNDALHGIDVDLPNTKSILPFLDLLTLVILTPNDLKGLSLRIDYPPDPFLLDDGRFVSVPADTVPDTMVFHIFDILKISEEPSSANYTIPLSPEQAMFSQQRYWRMPAKAEVILMVFMERIVKITKIDCEEVKQARIIYHLLGLQKCGIFEIGLVIGKKHLFEKEDEPSFKLPHRSRDKLRARNTTQKTTIARPGPRPRKKQRLKI